MKRPLLLASLLAFSLACPAEPGTPDEDAGTTLADPCNTPEEALSDPACELAEGVALSGHIGAAGDVDWYSVRVPAESTSRGLLSLFAGYSAPATPVSLTLQVFLEDGTTSIAREVNRPGQGAPKPIELIVPAPAPGTRLLLKLSDEGANPSRPAFDVRSPYSVRFDALENPDENEPNDVTPTALPLMGSPVQLGTINGFLATENDVDRFAFEVGAAEQVVYLRVSAPKLDTPPPFRLAYQLVDPSGAPISEGHVANEFIPVNLATARKAVQGTYTVVISQYRNVGDTEPIPGDLRLEYTLEVRVFPEVDTNEPNDRPELAPVHEFTATGGSVTRTGRIGTVGDPDWFAFRIPPDTAPTRLHYRLQSAGGAAPRFEPIPGPTDRQLRVIREVTEGSTASERRNACQSNRTICPKGFDPGDSSESLVQALCAASDPPQCLLSSREETPGFEALRNFEGILPIAPASSARVLYLVVQDEGQNWADDLDYTLEVRWLSDPDDAARYIDGAEAETPGTLQATASYPSAGAGATVLSGQLNHGFGRLNDLDPVQGESVRAAADYDAVPTDIDSFRLSLPAVDPNVAPDLAWALEWAVENVGSAAPHDLALQLEFCDGDEADGGVCEPVSRASRGAPLRVAYVSGKVVPWYGPAIPEQQSAFTKDSSGASTTVDVDPYACFCIEPRFRRGGHFKVDVVAVDRTSYAPANYEVRMAYAPYPQSYQGPDGGSKTCPAPMGDADAGFEPGCEFTRQP